MKFYKAYYLLYPFLIPHTLAGVLLCLVYGVRSIRWRAGCVEIVASRRIWGITRGAQTHGFIIFFSDDAMRQDSALQVHERVHVWQGLIMWGLPYIVVYVGDFLKNFIFVPDHYPNSPRWYRAYRGIYFEKFAYQIGDSHRDGFNQDAWGHLPK